MGKAFAIEKIGNEVAVTFQKRPDLKAIRQLEFSSRIIYGLVPDENNIWRPGKRSDFYISGFPAGIQWKCSSDTVLIGSSVDGFVIDDSYLEDLSEAIEGLCENNSEDGARYQFKITNGQETYLYDFHSRARTICALSVLYDLEWHPRKDLEIWINPDYTDKLQPGEAPDHERPAEQYYGDPSKTADVLRNEGWAREATNPYMYVEARQVGRQSQQHYRITQILQPLDNQVKRTNIKPLWRNNLFEQQNYTCQICLTQYRESPDQLSPDHRVPVVFEPDNLNDENYKTKLMTLCRYCNQAKREFTKRLRFDYDWEKSPWAYPEKHRMQIVLQQIRVMTEGSSKNVHTVLKEIAHNLSDITH